MCLERIHETAIAAARAGAAELTRYFRNSTLEVSLKGRDDYVTTADYASEEAIVTCIRKAFPSHEILAEESGFDRTVSASDHTWVIDPLDGTRNFSRGLPTYSVSVACLRGGRPIVGVILDPERDELFTAIRGGGARRNGDELRVSGRVGLRGAFLATGYPFRYAEALDLYLETFRDVFRASRGIRRCGSAALDLAYTAAGIYDGFFEFGLSAWDIAAGALLVEEAGGVISDLDGGDHYLDRGHVVAGTPEVWRELGEVLRVHADEATMQRLERDAADPVTETSGTVSA